MRTFLVYAKDPETGTAFYVEVVNGYLVGSHSTDILMRELPRLFQHAFHRKKKNDARH